MYDEYKKDHIVPLSDADVMDSVADKPQAAAKETQREGRSRSGIVVHGLYDVAVHFSKSLQSCAGR